MVLFFFFKQKTAYEMLRSLVGSEMCIRDRGGAYGLFQYIQTKNLPVHESMRSVSALIYETCKTCLLYTSDAADDLLCVDLGGRRSIHKKKRLISQHGHTTPNQFQ